MVELKNRQEILFLYDVKDANPNGDPLDENKPRMDEETQTNIVTDVRLKRTVRDYLYEYKGFNGEEDKDIFVRQTKSNKGEGIKDGKARAKDFDENVEEVLKRAIDIRLFGGVLPLDKSSITFTGPVQFNMGRSLNRVVLTHIKGTGAFASSDGAKQNTFREEYILPYSLIAFHGVVNEHAAKYTHLSEEDLTLLIDALWNGTKNLNTRSKAGHMPRLLVRVIYKEESNFFIGDLQKKIKISSELQDEKIRGIEDMTLDITELLEDFKEYAAKIEKIQVSFDKRFKFSAYDKEITFADIKEVKVEEVAL